MSGNVTVIAVKITSKKWNSLFKSLNNFREKGNRKGAVLQNIRETSGNFTMLESGHTGLI